MNGLEEHKFDQILKSKLEGHQLTPSRNLLPEILKSIDKTTGSNDGSIWKWSSILSVLLLFIAGGFIINSFLNTNNITNVNNENELTNAVGRDQIISKELNEKSDNSFDEFHETNVTKNEGEVGRTAMNDQVQAPIEIQKIDAKNTSEKSNLSKSNNTHSDVSSNNETISSIRTSGTTEDKESINSEALTTVQETNKGLSNDEKDVELGQQDVDLLSAKIMVTESKVGSVTNNDERFENHLSSTNLASNFSEEKLVGSTDEEINITNPLQVDKDMNSVESDISEFNIQSNNNESNIETDMSITPFMVDSVNVDTPYNAMVSLNNLDSLFNLKENKWSLDFLAGPSLSYRVFKVEDNQDLEEHKNGAESSLLTYSYKIKFARSINQKWRAHLGFMYLRMGEKYSFSNAVSSHSATNQYDYLSVPIGLEFLFFEKEKIELHAGAGAQYNFLQKGSSSWLDPHNYSAQTHTNEGEASPFREQTLALNANIELRYRLYDRIDLIIREEGVFFSNSIYKKETGIDQKEYSFETFLGFGYRF